MTTAPGEARTRRERFHHLKGHKMSAMTDPMNALVQLQFALENQIVELHPCEVHQDIRVVADRPNGTPRYTYAKVGDGKVQSIALFVLTEPIDGLPCFQMGWATVESMRRGGLATEASTKGIEELRNGLKRHGIQKIYLEAIISGSNLPSNILAKRLLSGSPVSCTDAFSGEPAMRYLRMLS